MPQDKTNMKKMAVREYEGVMSMLREVIMYQYEQSPNAVAFFRQQVGLPADVGLV